MLMTIAESLIEEGRQQGVLQGLQQGLLQGLLQGRQQGILQTAYEHVYEILTIRFGIVPRSLLDTMQRIENTAVLKTLHRQAITVQSLEDFTQALKKILS